MSSKFPVLLIFLLAYFEINNISAEVHFKKGSPIVHLSDESSLSGSVRFSRDGRPYTSFVGIPYGLVPERFQRAQPFPLWKGIKPAVSPGSICVQAQFGDGEAEYGEEDCLNLNVYVPLKNIGKKAFPVMVWIHGGGFQYGDGVGYGPKFFMDEDVILVTLNYRLGVFGFLSTEDSVIPGNNGLKDQVLALRWIRDNIAAFGGDPAQITIFGESAGACSVHYLLLSPTTDGLFKRAISQSNSATTAICFQPHPRSNAVQLATHLKCPTENSSPSEITSEEILSCFKKLSKSELIQAQFSYKKSWPLNYFSFYFVPTAEPEAKSDSKDIPFLTESPLDILRSKSKHLKTVPWMVGVTEDEGCSMYSGLVLKRKELEEELETKWESLIAEALHFDKYISSPEQRQSLAEKIREFYFGDRKISFETRDNLTNLYSDSVISYGVYMSALATAGRGENNPVYLYQYAYPGPLSFVRRFYDIIEEEAKKVGHADDIQHQFVLGKILSEGMDAEEIIKPDTEDEKFSKNFVKLWASFAIHGEPRHVWGDGVDMSWKPISKKELSKQESLKWFRIESNPTIEEDLYKERMAFWETIYDEYILNYNTQKDKKLEL